MPKFVIEREIPGAGGFPANSVAQVASNIDPTIPE
jgi:hypothetical protein